VAGSSPFGWDARDRIVDSNDVSILTKNLNDSGKVLPPQVPTAPVRAPTRTPARVAAWVL
jgi:hypothetical protein